MISIFAFDQISVYRPVKSASVTNIWNHLKRNNILNKHHIVKTQPVISKFSQTSPVGSGWVIQGGDKDVEDHRDSQLFHIIVPPAGWSSCVSIQLADQ